MTKSKSVFDHATHILKYQNYEYYNMLSDDDKNTFSTYMINRILSSVDKFDYVLIPAISEIDETIYKSKLPDNISYLLYINTIPKSNMYNIKYTKASVQESKYTAELITIISNYMQISRNTAMTYINQYYTTDSGKKYLMQVLESHGLDDKEIKKLMATTK